MNNPSNSVNILLVEDDEAIRLMLGELLSREGHKVFLARDGLSAVAFLENTAPELVITDYHMPEMNGWELALHIRHTFPHLPILLITGVPEDLSRAEEPGNPFDGVLAKPFPLDTLFSSIHAVLEKEDIPRPV